jgi:putative transcriptional regulator
VYEAPFKALFLSTYHEAFIHFAMIQIGQLLIAEPHLAIDRDFGKSVILITEVNTQGVVGFIINKPLSIRLNDVVSQTKNNLQVFNGGPVEFEHLYFIHQIPEKIEGGIRLTNELYWGGSFEQATDLLKQGELDSKHIRFFMGYSGWTYKQLLDEIAEQSWIVVADFNLNDLLKSTPNDLWKTLLAKQGEIYQEWINTPDDPRLN